MTQRNRVNVVKRGTLPAVVACIEQGMSLEQALEACKCIVPHVCETCHYRGTTIAAFPCNQCSVPRRTDRWKEA